MTGRIEEGMLCFDESLAAACAGEVRDLYVVESVFCGMFLTCERVHDVVRAEQWLRAAGDLVRRRSVLAVGPLCRAHYGGLTAAGRWDEAEAELAEAAKVFEGGYAAARAIVLVRLADLRVRQGRLEEAAALLEGMDQIPDAARPLAALHLARGETALARDVLERRLEMPAFPTPWPIAPSQPPPPPVAGPLLALLVEACVADGAHEDASAATERLAELAEHHQANLAACAALAKGRLCIATASGDARACLREALAAFSECPDAGRARAGAARAARAVASEQPEVAVSEAKMALNVRAQARCPRRGRGRIAAAEPGGAEPQGPEGREPLTKRETEVLVLLGHGLSNPEIAERLFISRKTVEHHVGHILSKLDLRNRSEAAAYATRLDTDNPVTK